MKRLSLVAGLLCFLFVACCPKADTEQKQEGVTEEQACDKESKCCKGMTEEEKAACKEFRAKWDDFDNQTEEVQKELVLKAKAKIDECEAKKAEFEAKWAKFDSLSVAEQKALIDIKMHCKKDCCKKEACCKKDGESKKCDKK
jgi:hypothetical protein